MSWVVKSMGGLYFREYCLPTPILREAGRFDTLEAARAHATKSWWRVVRLKPRADSKAQLEKRCLAAEAAVRELVEANKALTKATSPCPDEHVTEELEAAMVKMGREMERKAIVQWLRDGSMVVGTPNYTKALGHLVELDAHNQAVR